MSQLAAGADGTSIQIDLLASQEYYHDAGGNELGFVTRLYDDVLEHDPTPVEVATALTGLSVGGGTARSQLAQRVTLSPEARAIRVDAAFHTLLHHYPDSAELAGWVNKLPGSGASDGVLGTAMIAEIASSDAYYSRAGGLAGSFMSQLYEDLLNRPPGSVDLANNATLVSQISHHEAAARLLVAENLLSSGEFRADEITSFYATYLRPTCARLVALECTTTTRLPTATELSTALTMLAGGTSEEGIVAGVVGSDQYYQNHGSTQTRFVQAAYQDLLGRQPSNAELSEALNTYTNDPSGHALFVGSIAQSVAYRSLVVSLDYEELLLRAALPGEIAAGDRLLGGAVKSLQSPDDTLIDTIVDTPAYYADTGGSDADFVAGTVGALLMRPRTPEENSAYLQRPLPHDALWQAGVAGTILGGSEYRTNFVRGVYAKFLSFKLCAVSTGSAGGRGGLLEQIGSTLVVGLVVGALVIAVGVPVILRRRPTRLPRPRIILQLRRRLFADPHDDDTR
jgi:hypothetical protein